MADDISRKITIEVAADTGDLEQNITNLNKLIDSLTDKQNALTAAGQQNSAAFQSNAANIGTLNTALQQQQTAIDKSKASFEAQTQVVDQLKTSFTGLTKVSATFAPSLQQAAQGFTVMQSGVAGIKTGLQDTGAAIIAIDNQTQRQKTANGKKAAKELSDYEIQMAKQVSSSAFTLINNSIKQQSDAKIAALEKDKASELSNASLTSAQKLVIQQQYKQQEDQVKIKAFKDEQEASIAQAIINGALAVTKATAQTGVLSAFAIPAIIAETAVQVATISSKKPPAYAHGGLHYSSDGRGGVLPGYSRSDNTNAYLRSGEGIVVSEAMRIPWARNLVSAINVGFGGRDFSITNPGRGYAVGGIFTDGGDANRYYNQPVTDQKNLANTIAYQMINNFPPVYVDVKDVNNQQNILAQTINRVNL